VAANINLALYATPVGNYKHETRVQPQINVRPNRNKYQVTIESHIKNSKNSWKGKVILFIITSPVNMLLSSITFLLPSVL